MTTSEIILKSQIKNKYLAVIPARGGSKRLPNKNILPIDGHPLIAYSLNSVKFLNNYIDHIFSTDSHQIRELAFNYGANAPFLRPAYLSTDKITNYDVMHHAISYMEKQKSITYDAFILLQPTSPFRTSSDILTSITKFEKGLNPTLASVTGPFSKRHVILKKNSNSSSKELVNIGKGEPFYIYNASIYIVSRDYFFNKKSIHGTPESYHLMSEYAIDIDTKEDFEVAKLIFESSLFDLDPLTN